jgi:pyruvate decarboxylase
MQQKTKPLLHHTLGDGRYVISPECPFFESLAHTSHHDRYDAYLKAAQQFTWSQGVIFETNSAASEIDRVLTDCITSVGSQVMIRRAQLIHHIFPGSACVP